MGHRGHRSPSPEPERPSGETRIVWVNPQAKELPWVREIMAPAESREGPPYTTRLEPLVAYAEVDRSVRRMWGAYDKRCWVVHVGDPFCYLNAQGLVDRVPYNGVLPGSIAPNQPSQSAEDHVRANPQPWPASFRHKTD